MNFGKGFFCRVGLSLATATIAVAVVLYTLFNIDLLVEKLGGIFGSTSGIIEGIIHIPGLDFVLMALVSFVLSLTIVLLYVKCEMPYEVQRTIFHSPSIFELVVAFLVLISLVIVIAVTIMSMINLIYLFTFVSPAITLLVIIQYDAGCYKKVCTWITKHD